MRNKIGIIIFILLAVFSVGQLFYRTSLSTELSTQTTETSSRSRTDYIDPQGRITFAADRGYATVVKELDDGHVVLEQYLDAKGRAVTLPSDMLPPSRTRKYKNPTWGYFYVKKKQD